jgi:glycerophosphoryl diester phosphodiesterase
MVPTSEDSKGGTRFRRGPEGFIRAAHRGASGQAPENTHAAFAAALDLGVDAIELDCQLSADGELVVIHDETLDRTTDGRGPVAARTWAELAVLDAGAWRGPQFRGERIPRLADVLDQVRGCALLNVEIKSARDVGAIEVKLVALASAQAALEGILFSSFHEAAVRNLRATTPAAAIGVLWNHRPARAALDLAVALDARCIIPARRLVNARLVEAAHGRDLGVWAWTVNEVPEMRRLLALGVDALFSDHPERLRALAVGG